MSYFIRVFCESTKSITRQQIFQFVLDGVYFTDSPRFIPALGSAETSEIDWKRGCIHYEIHKRPIQFARLIAQNEVATEIEELKAEFKICSQAILEISSKCHQVIVFEISQQSLTDEAWEMLSALEAYLAQNWNGWIYAPSDGIYDRHLKLICKLPH